ncbi:MAG: radical SAM protein [Desulfatiglans sp.]|jgi:pyruvate-formate lyase-activating enzyme|nr:radical SAM protein [Desulfatiglans sp.]
MPDYNNLPHMLYADSLGRIYDHPHYRMGGGSGPNPVHLKEADLLPVPEYSKFFFLPECPPIGLDPDTGEFVAVPEVEIDGVMNKCFAVAVFLEPGVVRTYLPAADYSRKDYILPMWAYTAVGFRDGDYWAAGFWIEHNPKWDPNNYDDRDLVAAVESYQRKHKTSNLVEHLIHCATQNHCFAAKNLFLNRWEAPLPVSRRCNAACLGCLSLQTDLPCDASHQRIGFTPSADEIVSIAVEHLNLAPEAIVSFGQGCEGEPLTEHRLVGDSIRRIRDKTEKGTINLNTNGSYPERVREIIEQGLDSIRISLNSARPELYRAYYRPKDYDFDDVAASIRLSKEMGLYTMINYLVFPGITDQEKEVDALRKLIHETGVNFIHLKNLNIDPGLYLEKMPSGESSTLGMRQVVTILEEEFADLDLGYFNRPVR